MNRNKETTLEKAKCGKPVRITRMDSGHESHQRLCEMGFCEDTSVVKLIHGSALICLVCGVRVAISTRLAEGIFVREAACAQ